MKKILAFSILRIRILPVVCILLAATLLPSYRIAPSAGTQQPVVKRIKAADLHRYIAECNHPLIVSFWATFCVPCNKEIPYLQKIADQYKGQGVELLLVSLDLPAYYPRKIGDFAVKSDYHCHLAWLD